VGARIAGRAVADVRSVWRRAEPTTALRWTTSLLTTMPECARSRSFAPADKGWQRAGASFRTSSGAVISLPPSYTPGAREMFCRDVYLRSGLTMPATDWVVDLGANCGLFSIWAALNGAHVVAVEAQEGFAAEIRDLAVHNGVDDRVHVEIALAGGLGASGSSVGIFADDGQWRAASHSALGRPGDISVPEIIARYRIDRIGLLKVDIEGGEFAVLGDHDLGWLSIVDQVVLEVHRDFGEPADLAAQLKRYGFTARSCDNDGRDVPFSGDVDYAYCSR
jgi:FkbM family methyltransferase